MFNIVDLAVTILVALIASSHAAPLTAHAEGSLSIIITAGNTLNASSPAPVNPPPNTPPPSTLGSAQILQLSFVNNLPSTNVHAYVTGLDIDLRLVILQPNGAWFYPSADPSNPIPQQITADIAVPVPSTAQIALPDYISSGRIWFADGTLEFYTVQGPTGPSLVEPSAVNPSDPSAETNWGFVELTTNADIGVYADVSYVDFVGLPLGMTLDSVDGSIQSALGLPAGAVEAICNDMRLRAMQDGQPWDQLCVYGSSGRLLRVLSPASYLSVDNTAFSNYFTSYVNDVWSHFTSGTLKIDTQSAAGLVSCNVQNALLVCAGDNQPYAQPSADDIFSCNSGPFALVNGQNDIHRAVVPRLCAAFNRATFLISGGDLQPNSNLAYYTVDPHNRYSGVVHQHEVDGKGYAFPYDDVAPSGGANQAGVVQNGSPVKLTVTVGGPSSG